MKRILRSKLFISIVLLVLCFILIFVLLPKNYEAQNQTMQVVQLIDDVELGTQITDTMLVTKTIGRYGVDGSVITKREDIVGKYAANDLRRAANLYSDMFVEEWEEVEGVIDTMLKPGDKLIGISLGSGAQSVGGQIRTGSLVDVLTMKPEELATDASGFPLESKPEMELLPLLEGVRVYKVQNNALEDISELRRQWISLLETGSASAADFDASLLPVYVTLIVSEEQAVKLANQEYYGKVHLLLHPDGVTPEDDEDEKDETQVPEDGTEPTEPTGEPGTEGAQNAASSSQDPANTEPKPQGNNETA